MKSADVRKKFIGFYIARGHVEIPSAPLVPENDPTTLFTSSGMQPLIPYLLGQPHPLGKRLVNSQKSFRAQDIEEVGDNRHTTFFEMLGNWSLGDYFKREQLLWIFEILTKELGLDPKKLFVSVYQGNTSVPKDTESVEIWKEIFSAVDIEAKEGERILLYPASKNWWSRSGVPENMPAGEPGGPDSEVFYDFGESLGIHETSVYKDETCHPNCDCGRFLEIANSVFMEFQKQKDGSVISLKQQNVDFGGGLERLTAATEKTPDIFKTDLFTPLIGALEEMSGKQYGDSDSVTLAMRIVADHIKGAVMMMADGVVPSNKTQGYILRRLIRRSLLYGRSLGLSKDMSFIGRLVKPVALIYKDAYPDVSTKTSEIETLLYEEAKRFGKTLEKGLAEIEKRKTIDGKTAFEMYETYGFPWEMTEEIVRQNGKTIDRTQFEEEFRKHQELSRTAAKGMFKGGLEDTSEQTIHLHTAHHLLLAALQKCIDPSIKQRGSNITAERLRMDINFGSKITPEQLQQVETYVNETIQLNLPVVRVEMSRDIAEKVGAQMEFGHIYPDRVSIYFIGLNIGVRPETATPPDYFSAEFCGGPHVAFTGQLSHFTIKKEESAGSGIRRIYATIHNETANVFK